MASILDSNTPCPYAPMVKCRDILSDKSLGGLRAFQTGPTKIWAVQSSKMARDLKFCILEVEGLYYPYSENKGADQLRS